MFLVLSQASSRGIEPHTFGFPRSDALSLSHRGSTVSEVYHKVHMTRVLLTVWISTFWVQYELLGSVVEKYLSVFLYRAQNLLSLLFYWLIELVSAFYTFYHCVSDFERFNQLKQLEPVEIIFTGWKNLPSLRILCSLTVEGGLCIFCSLAVGAGCAFCAGLPF